MNVLYFAALEHFESIGCHLNNLFQRADGAWQINVRKIGTQFGMEYVIAPTAMEAVAKMTLKLGEQIPEAYYRTGKIEQLCVAISGLTDTLRKLFPEEDPAEGL